MSSRARPDVSTQIIEKAKALGASLAGITRAGSLERVPSHEMNTEAKWPMEAKSVIVLALAHEASTPELDWWDDKPGGSPGNRRLIGMAQGLRQWLNEALVIDARPLPYHVDKGGIFLKDAAALAGLGIIGRNNLLVTPESGPRVRLRALLLDVDLKPTDPIEFAPCDTCGEPCRRACPRKAFRNGSYGKTVCNIQMMKDVATRSRCVKYCRACELACPVSS